MSKDIDRPVMTIKLHENETLRALLAAQKVRMILAKKKNAK